jgi:hypothetical protein
VTIGVRLYLIVSGAIFFLVAVFHFFRILNHWPVMVGATPIPFILSYVGLPASSAYFIWACWLLARKIK